MTNRAAVIIPEKLFFKIGEVCEIVGIQAHVLRYWESEFPMLAPQKNRAGQRTYRKRDVEMVLRIKELLYDEMYTIPGARKRLQTELRGASKLKVVTPEMAGEARNAQTESSTDIESNVSSVTEQTPAFAQNFASTLDTFSEETSTAHAQSSTEAVTGAGLTEKQKHAMKRLRRELNDVLTMLEKPR